MVQYKDGMSFVVADIPGLIEGASEGVGLGHQFLRHVERCRVLVHLVDLSAAVEGRDPVHDFDVLNRELSRYSPELADKPQLVVANKLDLPHAREALPKLQRGDEEARHSPSSSCPAPPARGCSRCSTRWRGCCGPSPGTSRRTSSCPPRW